METPLGRPDIDNSTGRCRRHRPCLTFWVPLVLVYVAVVINSTFSRVNSTGCGAGELVIAFSERSRENTATEYRYSNHGSIRAVARGARARDLPWALLVCALSCSCLLAQILVYRVKAENLRGLSITLPGLLVGLLWLIGLPLLLATLVFGYDGLGLLRLPFYALRCLVNLFSGG